MWNAYNRVPILVKAGDSTATWTYGTATWRASNGAASTIVSALCGLAEECYDVTFLQDVTAAGSAGAFSVGIGLNGSSSGNLIGTQGTAQMIASGGVGTAAAYALKTPALGLQTFTAMEDAISTVTITVSGTEASSQLRVAYRG